MMCEKNNAEVAAVITDWIGKVLLPALVHIRGIMPDMEAIRG